MRKITSYVFGFVFLFTASSCDMMYAKENKGAAEESARKYASELYPNKQVNVSCASRDSDNDGYYSCTLVVEGNPEPVQIECHGYFGNKFYGDGCRLVKLNLINKIRNNYR